MQGKFLAIHNTNDKYEANPFSIDMDRVRGTNLLPNTSSDDQTPQDYEAEPGTSHLLFNDNAATEIGSSQSSRSQHPVTDSHLLLGPGRLWWPERDLSRLQVASQSPFHWVRGFDGRQCACLMLFFIEKLAPHV